MSAINLDEPGFNAPAGSTAPPSSDSSVEHPSEGRRKCVACPKRMSAKTADRHTICVLCRGFNYSVESRCEECIEWPEEEIRLYTKMCKSLKSKSSSKHRNKPSASLPPSADSVPSSQPSAIAQMQSQVESLNLLVNSLSESLFARLDALTASIAPASVPQSSSQPNQGPDAELPQPGVTTGESRMFQALGATSRTSDANARLGKGVRDPRQEYFDPSAAPQPHAAPEPAPQPSATFVPPQPPPRSGFHHPSLSRQGGSPQDLLLLVHVALARPRSRRLARLKVKLPFVITLLLASLTSFTRLVPTRLRSWMILVSHDATLRDGSASLSALLLDLASGFTPGLGR